MPSKPTNAISKLIVLLITLLIIICSLVLYFDQSDLIPIKSKYDNHIYYVRNLRDKHKAVKLLTHVRFNLIKVVNHLKHKYPDDPRILFLIKNFKPNSDNISESIGNSKYTSYTINKGQKVVFCIRQRDMKNNLCDFNTIMFVALHELTHMMTKSRDHVEEFWENMKFVLKEVITSNLNVYKYQPYHKIPREYCGTTITDTPYKHDQEVN